MLVYIAQRMQEQYQNTQGYYYPPQMQIPGQQQLSGMMPSQAPESGNRGRHGGKRKRTYTPSAESSEHSISDRKRSHNDSSSSERHQRDRRSRDDRRYDYLSYQLLMLPYHCMF